MGRNVCPCWFAYTFDNPIRNIFHDSKKIFAPYLSDGMSAIDLGCGMGFFSIGMAKIVGESGKIISVDIQQDMLDILLSRAKEQKVDSRIKTVLCSKNDINVDEKVDFALTFWMVHETPDELHFLKQVHSILKESSKLLLVEPKIHVTSSEFIKTLALAENAGFKLIDSPKIFFSHTALLEKK